MNRCIRSSPAIPVLLAAASAFAVTPISPSLDEGTRVLVLQQLARTHVPEVGQNSVVIAMISALGITPRDSAVEYDEPYPQLPTVTVGARVLTLDCVSLTGVVQHAPDAGHVKVLITGKFCLADRSRWNSVDFVATLANPA